MFKLNPDLDRNLLAAKFAADRRVQVRDLLTSESAQHLSGVLRDMTPWGLSWQAGAQAPHSIRHNAMGSLSREDHEQRALEIARAMGGRDYAFEFFHYPMLQAYLERWNPDSIQDMILEHINDQPFLNLVREVSGMSDLIKADAQATLYGPGHFLSRHDDSHVAQGWKLAYVINLSPSDWRPDWGGYLNFLNDDGDIVAGWKPRYNCLNLFAVPQAHQVSFVPPFSPVDRFAITGWFRNR